MSQQARATTGGNILKFIVLLTLLPNIVFAASTSISTQEDKALYEIGIAGGSGSLPDYPASNQNHTHTLVVPAFIYRGDKLRADAEDGMRAQIFKNPNLDLDISFSGSFQSDSVDNYTRAGMPDLDYLGEIGPQLTYYFIRDPNWGRFRLQLPVRGVFSTNFSNLNYIGADFTPELYFEKFRFPCSICSVSLSTTANIVDTRIAQYFYEVEPKYATIDRAAYGARAGYLGTDFDIAFIFDWKKFAVFANFDYTTYQGSSNTSSPLFKTQQNTSVFVALIWFFYESKERGYKDSKENPIIQ